MKQTITIIFTFLTIIAIAQTPTGDIQKDTTLARQYYEEALGLINSEDTSGLGDKLLTLLTQAQTLSEAHSNIEQLVSIKGLLSYVHFHMSNPKAEPLAREAIELGEKHLTPKSNALTIAYYTLGTILGQRSPQEAAMLFNKGLECTPQNSDWYFNIGFTLGVVYRRLAKIEALGELIIKMENALSVYTGDTTVHTLDIYDAKTQYYRQLQNHEKAVLYGQKVLSYSAKHQLYTVKQTFDLYTNLAEIYFEDRKYDEGLEYLTKARNLYDRIEDIPDLEEYYYTIAYTYSKQRKYALAVEYYKKSANICLKDTTGKFDNTLGYLYGNLSHLTIEWIVYDNTSETNYDEALEYYYKAAEYSKSKRYDYLLGFILVKQKKFKESVEVYHKAVLDYCTVFNSPNIYDNPSPYEVFVHPTNGKANVWLKAKSILALGYDEKDITIVEKGLSLLKQSINWTEEDWEMYKGFDRSKYVINKELLGKLYQYIEGQYFIYEMKPSDEVFEQILWATEKTKAIQLIETLTPSLLPKEEVAREQELMQKIQNTGHQLDLAQAKAQTDSIKYFQDQLFDLHLTLDTYIEKIQTNHPKETNHFRHTKYATSADIQSFLPEGTLLVSYSIFWVKQKIYILTVSSSNKQIIELPIGELADKIKKLNKLTQNRAAFQKPVRDAFAATSHDIYKILIEPIESQLEGKTQLMFVIEDQLFNLPFELLVTNNEKKPYQDLDFLIKKYEINYQYSATAFQQLQQKTTTKDHSFLAFAPVFATGEEMSEATRALDFMVDSLYRGFDDGKFSALPNTRKEVNSIAQLVKTNNGSARVLLSENATRANLLQGLEQQPYQFIHVSTHGLVNFKNSKLSALACHATDDNQDNLLYASEIQLKGVQADLVVLSSCESGIGQLIDGEGMIALHRSFIYSGAKNVLFSLWKVNDKHSSTLMIDFYNHYFKGESYTNALRQAKLKMLADPITAQPKYWAPFVLMGE